MRRCAEVVAVGLEDDTVVFLPAVEHERSRSHRVVTEAVGISLDGGTRHHAEVGHTQHVNERRIGTVEDDLYREFIDFDQPLHGRGVTGAERRRAQHVIHQVGPRRGHGGIDQPCIAVDHVIRGHLRAIVEPDVLAQLEFVLQAVI